ncbi:MAG: hypothetical protein ABIZ91_06825 [Gemmatimonadaceae bacterium]
MFIRGPHQEAHLGRHFRGDVDGFVFTERGGICEAHVLANADRAVELYVALAEHMPPAVTLEVDDYRTGRRWRGEDLSLFDVRDMVARLKKALATYAGLEFTIFGPDDQLSLTPNLDLFVFARSDRWLYLLQGKGLRRLPRLRTRSWRLERGEFPDAPAMLEAVDDAVQRLGLEVVATREGA